LRWPEEQKKPVPWLFKPAPERFWWSLPLSGFGDFPGFNAAGTNFHPLCATLGPLHANRLQIGIKPPGGPVIRVGNIITELGTLAANFATFSHDFYDTSRAC